MKTKVAECKQDHRKLFSLLVDLPPLSTMGATAERPHSLKVMLTIGIHFVYL